MFLPVHLRKFRKKPPNLHISCAFFLRNLRNLKFPNAVVLRDVVRRREVQRSAKECTKEHQQKYAKARKRAQKSAKERKRGPPVALHIKLQKARFETTGLGSSQRKIQKINSVNLWAPGDGVLFLVLIWWSRMSGRKTSGKSRPSLGAQVLAVFSFVS